MLPQDRIKHQNRSEEYLTFLLKQITYVGSYNQVLATELSKVKISILKKIKSKTQDKLACSLLNRILVLITTESSFYSSKQVRVLAAGMPLCQRRHYFAVISRLFYRSIQLALTSKIHL